MAAYRVHQHVCECGDVHEWCDAETAGEDNYIINCPMRGTPDIVFDRPVPIERFSLIEMAWLVLLGIIFGGSLTVIFFTILHAVGFYRWRR